MIENEGIRVEEAPSCLLCGGEGVLLYSGLRDRLFSAPGKWALMRCPTCGLVWLNLRQIPADIGKLYSQYYTHQVPDAPKSTLAGLRKSVKASILQYSFAYQMEGSSRILGSVFSKIGPLKDIVGGSVRYLESGEKRRLLDVGCGNGWFLNQMRQLGWDVAGVEPDEEASSIAREKFGLKIFIGSLEEAKFPDGHFDAITMNHVIEHAPDPVGLLKECCRTLRQRGNLIVVTPNIKSKGCRIFGDKWLHWDPPRHLFLFSPETLQSSAGRAKLTIRSLRTTAKDARLIWAASRLIKQNGRLPGGAPNSLSPRLRMEGLVFQAAEHGFCGRGPAGEDLVLVATK